MIDVELVDKMFDLGIEIAVFDKRTLFPLPQLAELMSARTGQTVTVEDLEARAAQGWFPLLPGAGEKGDEPGAPIYTAERLELYLGLEHRGGYSSDELRDFAQIEESLIDDVLTTDDLAYLDDDLDTLILNTEYLIQAFEDRTDCAPGVDPVVQLSRGQQNLKFFQRLKRDGIPEQLKSKIARHAYRVRAFNDALRVQLLEQDRAKIRAGYSPSVHFEHSAFDFRTGVLIFAGERLNWEWSLRSALALESSTPPRLRVPGFLLEGDRVLSTETLIPTEYEAKWKQHDLGAYLQAWSRVRGERRCLNCLEPLPTDADDRKKFCSDRCRHAVNQRRYRQSNPGAVERTQKRYWESVDFGDGDQEC